MSALFQIHSLFPTPVYSGNIGRAITNDELKVVESHYSTADKGTLNWHSKDSYILDHQLEDIKKFIDLHVQQYVKNIICPNKKFDFYITQSWLNWTKEGEEHHAHRHPNSLLSGVFYISADREKDSIIFQKNEYCQLQIYSSNKNDYNRLNRRIAVGSGDLLLFPSNLEHRVSAVVSSNVRISLAFNVFARGEFGSANNLTRLMVE